MSPFLRATVLLAVCSGATHAQLVINEVDADTAGTDLLEFIELYDGGTGNTSLDGLVLVFFNGNGDTSYRAIDLDGFATDEGGFFLVGNAAVVPAVSIVFQDGGLQNGADGIGLYTGRAADFPNGTPVTSDNLVDGLVYDTDDEDDEGLIAVLGGPQMNEAANGNKDDHSIYRAPDGGPFAVGNPTPGAPNPDLAPLSLNLSEASVSEGAVNPALTGTVSRPTTAGDVAVTVTVDDESEAVIFDAVFLFDGEDSADFGIEVVNDFFPDGAQTVTVTASAPGFSPAEASFEVTDDGDAYGVVVNEVFYAEGDANGDGLTNFSDHFIELVNVGGGPVDLTDYHLEDLTGTQFNFDGIHRFPAGTVLDPGCALVVFGGSGATAGTTAAFGNAEVQISSNDGLFLNRNGERVRLLNELNEEVYVVDLPDIVASQAEGSVNLVSEGDAGDPALGYGRHATLSATNEQFSPGLDFEGGSFCTVGQALSLTLLDGDLLTPIASIPEDGAAGSVIARVEAPDRAAGEVVVFRIRSALGDLVAPGGGVGVLDDASPVADFPLDPVDNVVPDGTRTETITVSASTYLNGTATIEVTDDGDTETFMELVINEVDADQIGTDDREFVELYNLTEEEQSLDGLVLVLVNGNGDRVYRVAELSGSTIPAAGYFVVGLAAVPNVDLVPLDWPFDNAIQNGADAVALYQGAAADFPVGTELGAISNLLIDAVVYDTGDPDDDGLIAALTPGQAQIDENGKNARETESIQRVPDGGTPLDTSTYTTQPPTPGLTNTATSPPEEELLDLAFDFAAELVVATAAGLQPGLTYVLEGSADGGEGVPFAPVGAFTTADPNVIASGGGVFEVRISDPFLADLVTNPRQIYRLSRP